MKWFYFYMNKYEGVDQKSLLNKNNRHDCLWKFKQYCTIPPRKNWFTP